MVIFWSYSFWYDHCADDDEGGDRVVLTDAQLKVLKAADGRKQQWFADQDGLQIMVTDKGKKRWFLRYQTSDGTRHRIALGSYPEVSLKEARELCYRTRREKGLIPKIDPATGKIQKPAPVILFKDFADAYLKETFGKKHLAATTERAKWGLLNNHILPFIGNKDLKQIEPLDIKPILDRLIGLKKRDVPKRAIELIVSVFDHAVILGHITVNPASSLHRLIPSTPQEHQKVIDIDPKKIGALMSAIYRYQGSVIIQQALLLVAYTFCRSNEVCGALWSEVDIKKREWRIPAERMKMKRPHIVPLVDQTVKIFEFMEPISKSFDRHVFPGRMSADGTSHVSGNGLLQALEKMGYDGENKMSVHGFRSIASTILNDNGFNRDHVERQLAHVEGNKIRAAYNHAEFIDDRREMMRWYADHLDELRDMAAESADKTSKTV